MKLDPLERRIRLATHPIRPTAKWTGWEIEALKPKRVQELMDDAISRVLDVEQIDDGQDLAETECWAFHNLKGKILSAIPK